MTELLLILNLTALNAVIIHSIAARKTKKEYAKPKLGFKRAEKHELTEEEKRDAEILSDISNYNGIEVRKSEE